MQIQRLEYRPALDYFQKILQLENPVWLDSGVGTDSKNPPANIDSRRFDILTALPNRLLKVDTQEFDSLMPDNQDKSAISKIRETLAELTPVETNEDIPFCGGLIGYLTYESNHAKQGIARRDGAKTPQVLMGLYSWAIILDHLKKAAQLIFHPDCPAEIKISVSELIIQNNTPRERQNTKQEFQLQQAFQASQSESEYRQKIETIINYLKAGDCYQVNLAQHFSAKYQGHCAQAYIKLRNLTPTPHSAYLGFNNAEVLSLSPERFVQVRGNQVETWPIKGTAPRSENPALDAQLGRQLSDSEKNRAENLMIVDLMRNDLSICCKPGSIRVPGLYELHSFPTVHHLVSRVNGELKDGLDALSILDHCLPGGSITGAPKKRAMQIIQELEKRDRGVYCGCIGYLSSCGSMDTNIAIRTLQADGEKLHAWGGGGIVVDSNPESEYQETLDKIRPLLKRLEQSLKA